MIKVAALFIAPSSPYWRLLGVECYGIEQDARSFCGGMPIVAHPPCRTWGRLRAFAKAPKGEHELSLWAVTVVRRNGGVLEHPAASTLWDAAGLPRPLCGQDAYGGWSLSVDQWWWGHRARKATWLYLCGVEPRDLPAIPYRMGEPAFVVQSRKRTGHRPYISKRERLLTPPKFAEWLVAVARSSSSNLQKQTTEGRNA